jgi:hypothetical protein
MTNKQILDELYNKLREGQTHSDMIDFIEQEWQLRDEEGKTSDVEWRTEIFKKIDDGQKYNMNDVNENSAGEGAHGRFVKLKISKDGTVEEIG